jgi:hypothetical protein
MRIVNSKMYIRSGVIKELIIFLWTRIALNNTS